jgi:hypothetical protein
VRSPRARRWQDAARMRTNLWVGFLLASALAAGCAAQGKVSYMVTTQPPQAKVESLEPRPGLTYVQGRWENVDGKWLWHDGTWTRQKDGYVWVQGRWADLGGRWQWHPGHWERERAVVVHN